MESKNDKQSRYDEYERREYEKWVETIKKIKDLGGDTRTQQH